MNESIKTRFLESRTPKLAFDIRGGAKPTLLCVHGNSSHRGLWAPLLRRLPDYAALRLDLRGHGESEWTRPLAYSTADYADEFIGASAELGEFETGVVARLLGPVGAAIFGGVGSLVITGAWSRMFPSLRKVDRLGGTDMAR